MTVRMTIKTIQRPFLPPFHKRPIIAIAQTGYQVCLNVTNGIITSKNTFQKYYTQRELRDYIASTLSIEPVPACPGVFYVFKSDDYDNIKPEVQH